MATSSFRRNTACETDSLRLASLEPIRIGMPELCRAGLSETWLWKACGHRHWLALAAAHGLDLPDFRDPDGERLYPAFTDVTIANGRLDAVREHDALDFGVTLSRTGRTRFLSRTTVSANGRAVATVTMESAFLLRAIAGCNRSATRGLVARPSRLLPPVSTEPPFRLGQWNEAFGFRRADRHAIASHLLDPSPHEDFNGADFLYFVAFQAMVDRAEWAWFRRSAPLLATRARRVVYAGNIELGDRIRAVLCSVRDDGSDLSTWIELARESDGATIAIAFTSRTAFGNMPA